MLLAAKLCRRFEGLYLRPYLCPAGVPTIGYGSTVYENGMAVQLTDPPITRERAEGDARAADRIVAADPTRYRIVPLP